MPFHTLAALCIALGQHTRAGIEENLWTTRKGERMTSVQMIEKHVRIARELGREVATGDDARRIMKVGVTYNSVEETLFNLGRESCYCVRLVSNTAWQINWSRASTILAFLPLRFKLCGSRRAALPILRSGLLNDTRRETGGGAFSLNIFLTNRSDPKKGA
jgi:hypothetical protein